MSKLRPGVDAGKRLFACSDLTVWQSVDELHDEDIVDRVKDLKKVQQQYRALGDQLLRIDGASLSKKDLLLVVQWKFLVGKPRQALLKHLNANTEHSVQQHSTAAIQLARSIPTFTAGTNDRSDAKAEIKQAIEALTNLHGVGPATASAVLSLVRPDVFAYMYDEAIESCGLKRTYNMTTYLAVNEHCQSVADKLGIRAWTTARVARALWTASRAKAFGLYDHTTSLTQNKTLKRVDEQSQKANPEKKRQKRSQT
ncbi:hypothetical protein IV203_034826 [Nitzschia inconspicua]|uniref:Uncharacterized protein n=1 Tax=Nitzschia inconspicua TaxID=303405 RepID=A0A9K3PU91_9STRA|nr:hypothetical protein IV203_034826 [Nitzschia inconspicua]